MEDQNNEPHLFMKFYVEGPENQGTVKLEMIKVTRIQKLHVYSNNLFIIIYRTIRRSGNTRHFMLMYQDRVITQDVFTWKENKDDTIEKKRENVFIIIIIKKKNDEFGGVGGGDLFIEGETLLFSSFLWSHRSSRFQTTFLFF